MSSLVEYIRESQNGSDSVISEALIKAASEENKDVTDSEEEIRRKFHLYRQAEIDHNLLQIPYSAFNKLPYITQAEIKSDLDPLLWGAVYCLYDNFLSQDEFIFRYIDSEHEFTIIEEMSCFVLLCNDSGPAPRYNPSILSRSRSKHILSKKVIKRYHCVGGHLVISEA